MATLTYQHSAAFTIDVEDGVSIAMRDAFGKQVKQTDRVVHVTEQTLQLLDKYETYATFFVLGKVAEDFPQLIKQIAKQGHELGIHGYDHLKFHEINRKQARDQLKRAKDLVENISGMKVHGHRAPAFSINESTKWAFEILTELGFTYDSSIMPCKATHYGWEGFSKDICNLRLTDGSSLYEVPMSTLQICSFQTPVLGGSYLRLLPYWITQKACKKIAAQRSPILYIHPYELDTERYPQYYFDELKENNFLMNIKMRSNWLRRGSLEAKLENLLSTFSFTTMKDILHSRIVANDLEEIKITN